MNTRSPSSPKSLLLLNLCLFLVLLFCIPIFFPIHQLVYFNFSKSMPQGIYIVSHCPILQAHLVVIPSSKIQNYREQLPPYLLKILVPYHGETVTINDIGLFLDGNLLARKIHDIGINFNSILAPGQALILGISERSFDSRYFGPVNLADLTPVRSFLIW